MNPQMFPFHSGFGMFQCHPPCKAHQQGVATNMPASIENVSVPPQKVLGIKDAVHCGAGLRKLCSTYEYVQFYTVIVKVMRDDVCHKFCPYHDAVRITSHPHVYTCDIASGACWYMLIHLRPCSRNGDRSNLRHLTSSHFLLGQCPPGHVLRMESARFITHIGIFNCEKIVYSTQKKMKKKQGNPMMVHHTIIILIVLWNDQIIHDLKDLIPVVFSCILMFHLHHAFWLCLKISWPKIWCHRVPLERTTLEGIPHVHSDKPRLEIA